MNYLVADNELTLLHSGIEYFPRLIADLDRAQHTIYLESYIFAGDQTGHQVVHALLRAAQRDVTVRVLLDGFGSSHFPAHWQAEFQAAGVHFQWFRREVFRFKFRRHRLRRLHRKLVSIDGHTAFIGGINILNDQPNRHIAPRLDYAVRIHGAMAGEIQTEMHHLWQSVSWAKRGQRGQWLRLQHHEQYASAADLSLLLRDNLYHRRDIERAYLHAMIHAQHEIVLACAYFLPGRVFRRVLKQASRRGVRVILLLQGKVEYHLQHYASHALYGELLSAGIEIYEYQPSYLHAKVAVIDQCWTTIGSSNIDPFSLLLAREANLVIQHPEFAQALRTSLLAATRHATRIHMQDWQQLHWFTRGVSWCSYSLLRMVMGVLGYGKRRI